MQGFSFQFCDVATVATIDKSKEPNVATGRRGQLTFSRIFLCSGDLQEPSL
jgi:hypothetical protein